MVKHIDKVAAKKGTPSQRASRAEVMHERGSNSTHIAANNSSIAPLKTKSEALKAAEKRRDTLKTQYMTAAKSVRNADIELKKAIDDYCQEADLVCNGDEEIINDLGLSKRSKPTSIDSLEVVTDIILANGTETGHILVSFGKVKGANRYEIYSTVTPEDKDSYRIIKSVSHTRDIDLNSYKRGETACIKVKALGKKNVESPLQQQPATIYVV